MKPVKKRRPPDRISPTDSSIGKVEPSLRWPTTTRPMPMILRSPVAQIAVEIAVMALAIRRRHQGLDILAHGFAGRVAEQRFGGGAEGMHDAVSSITIMASGNGIEDRLQVRFARQKVGRRRGGVGPPSGHSFAEPRNAGRNDQKDGALEQPRKETFQVEA